MYVCVYVCAGGCPASHAQRPASVILRAPQPIRVRLRTHTHTHTQKCTNACAHTHHIITTHTYPHTHVYLNTQKGAVIGSRNGMLAVRVPAVCVCVCVCAHRRLVQLMGSLAATMVLSKSTALAAPALLYPFWSPWIRAGLKNVEIYSSQLKSVGLWRAQVRERAMCVQRAQSGYRTYTCDCGCSHPANLCDWPGFRRQLCSCLNTSFALPFMYGPRPPLHGMGLLVQAHPCDARHSCRRLPRMAPLWLHTWPGIVLPYRLVIMFMLDLPLMWTPITLLLSILHSHRC